VTCETRAAGLAGEQPRQRQDTSSRSLRSTTNRPVGVLRQFAALAQVAGHDLMVMFSRTVDRVHVHQAAGGVFRVGQHRIQTLAILLVGGEQDRAMISIRTDRG